MAGLLAGLLATGSTGWTTESRTPSKTASGTTQKTQPVASKKTSARARPVTKTARKNTVKANAVVPADPAQAEAMEQERSALKEKLAQLKRAIAASESSRSEVADQLAVSERAISDVNRKLRELDSQQSRVQNQLNTIGQRQNDTQSQIAQQQAQLGSLLRQQYVAGAQDPFRLLFSGDNPNNVQRDLAYMGYVAEAEVEVVRSLRGNLDHLNKLGEETAARNQELASIAEEQQSSRAALVKEQVAKRTTLASISSKLEAQRREAGALERDEQRLAKVVAEIARVLARQEQERRDREKKQKEREQEQLRERQRQLEAAKKSGMPAARPELDSGRATASSSGAGSASEAKPNTGSGAAVDTSSQNVLTPQPGFSGNIAALKGQLRLPVRGEVTARFGKVRADGGPSWKGLFIRAAEGMDVKAIAAGRVVFAEWLRGFGNLLIVDHGNQYLSIYGNNEALLKQAGDTVQSGDVVASVGNSGGNPESGLYFEMRYQGRPFDPLSWARLR